MVEDDHSPKYAPVDVQFKPDSAQTARNTMRASGFVLLKEIIMPQSNRDRCIPETGERIPDSKSTPRLRQSGQRDS
jgi:hypothetical protein